MYVRCLDQDMFERHQEELDWFKNQHEQDQIQILSDWIEDNDEQVIERIGEQNEEPFRRILGSVRDELQDATREVLLSELTSEHFSPAVATLLIQASSQKSPDDDLRYIRRNVDGINDLQTLSEENVNVVLSRPRKDEPEYEVGDSLMQISRSVVWHYILYQYVPAYDGHTEILERLTETNGYSEEEANTFLEPVQENMDELIKQKQLSLTFDISNNIQEISDNLSQIQSTVDNDGGAETTEEYVE